MNKFILVLALLIPCATLASSKLTSSKSVTLSDHEVATKLCKYYGGYKVINLSNKSNLRMDVTCVRGGSSSAGRQFKNVRRIK
jgi:hypothetical protein